MASRRAVVSLAVLGLSAAVGAWLAFTAPRRSLDVLIARARQELDAERTRTPEPFPRLDGSEGRGELLSILGAEVATLREAPTGVFERHALEPLRAGRLHAFSPLLAGYRDDTRELVVRLRSALTGTTVAPRLVEDPLFDSAVENRLAVPLELASFAALDGGRSDEALDLALDAWRLRYAVRRAIPPDVDSFLEVKSAAALVAGAAASATTERLARLDRELDVLESLAPRPADLVRRTRLLSDAAFVALAPNAPDVRAFRAQWLVAHGLYLAIERELDPPDPGALARVNALAARTPSRPVLDPFRIVPFVENLFAELAALRKLRSLVATRQLRAPRRGALDRVDLSFEDVNPDAAAAAISRRTGHPVAASSVTGERFSFARARLPWREAVAEIASASHAAIRELPRGTLYLHEPPRVSFGFHEADLRLIVGLVEAYGGENVILDPRIRAQDVTVSFQDLDWRVALAQLAYSAHLDVVALPTRSRITYVTPAPPSRPPTFFVRDHSFPDLPDVSDLRPAKETLDLELQGVALGDALEGLGRELGLELRHDPEVSETVTLDLCETPWSDALQLMAAHTLCELRREGRALVFKRSPSLTYQAAQVPAHLWFEVIGQRDGLTFEIPAGLDGWVSLDLKEVEPRDVVLASAAAAGWRATARGNRRFVFEADGPPPPRPSRVAPPTPPPLVERPPPVPDDPMLRREVDQFLTSLARDTTSRDTTLLGKATTRLDKLARGSLEWRVLAASVLATHDELVLVPQAAVLAGELIGNLHLQAASRAIKAEKFGDALADLACVGSLATTLHGRGTAGSVIAEALEARAGALEAEARALARIARLPIRVTAILLDPRPGGTDLAIVNGFPRGAGAPLLDAAGLAVPDVFVVKITPGSIKLRAGAIEFVRELDSR